MIQLNSISRRFITAGALLTLAVFIIYVFPRYDNTFPYHIEIGKPWAYERLTAEFDFPIYKTDVQLTKEREELLADFAPCYTYREDRTTSSPLVLSYTEMEQLRQEGYTRIALVDKRVSTIVPISEVYTPKSAYAAFHHEYTPNIAADTATTAQMLSALLSSQTLTQGVVQAGEKIIDRGEIVNESNYQILSSLRRALEDEHLTLRQRVLSNSGATLLVLLFLTLFVTYLFVFRPGILEEVSSMLYFCILSGITVLLSSIVLRFTSLSIYIIPFAWIPIITRVFYDSRTALFHHLVTVYIVSLAVPAPYEFLVLQTIAGMVAVSSLKDMTRRAQMAQTAGWILLTYAGTYTALTLRMSGDWHSINPYLYLYFLINAALVICAYGLIYLFERTFRLLSAITLVELTDINSPLLRQLAERAPGTFQHSMQVSSLASEAAKKIGAKVLLVRTGALYHDIGKLSHPEYFTENQYDGQNPLLALPPDEASAIIISHVTEGVRLAHQYRLPSAIINFIESHHGCGITRYFYNTYVNQHPDQAIDRSLFQYPGPRPSTKEAAILMMADVIEACSRSLPAYTEEAISEMVDKMINQMIQEGEFADTPLSFKDVEDIREVFKAKLATIYHQRIQYPTLKKE